MPYPVICIMKYNMNFLKQYSNILYTRILGSWLDFAERDLGIDLRTVDSFLKDFCLLTVYLHCQWHHSGEWADVYKSLSGWENIFIKFKWTQHASLLVELDFQGPLFHFRMEEGYWRLSLNTINETIIVHAPLHISAVKINPYTMYFPCLSPMLKWI